MLRSRAVSRSPDREPFVRAPRLVALRTRITGLPHARVDRFPAVRRPRARDDLPLTFLVGEAVAQMKLHRERAVRLGLCLRRGRWRLPLRAHFDFGLLGGGSFDADTLGRVPTPYLPTSGLVDSLDASVEDPSPRRAVRRGGHLPLPPLVSEAVANP